MMIIKVCEKMKVNSMCKNDMNNMCQNKKTISMRANNED